jgi:hypothetical protein
MTPLIMLFLPSPSFSYTTSSPHLLTTPYATPPHHSPRHTSCHTTSPHLLLHHLITSLATPPLTTPSLPLSQPHHFPDHTSPRHTSSPPHHCLFLPLQVIQLASGMCVALEVRAENAVSLFRETAGTVYSIKHTLKITKIPVEEIVRFFQE